MEDMGIISRLYWVYMLPTRTKEKNIKCLWFEQHYRIHMAFEIEGRRWGGWCCVVERGILCVLRNQLKLWGWLYCGWITCSQKLPWLVHMSSVNVNFVWWWRCLTRKSDAAAPRESEAEPSADRATPRSRGIPASNSRLVISRLSSIFINHSLRMLPALR